MFILGMRAWGPSHPHSARTGLLFLYGYCVVLVREVFGGGLIRPGHRSGPTTTGCPGMIAGIRGTMRNVSSAALSVARLAAAATPVKCAAWARKGPAAAPVRVAAASPVRNTALTRPSSSTLLGSGEGGGEAIECDGLAA